jgi:hypothetical protein
MLSLKATISGGYGTGSSSLYGTGLIADGKCGYFTVCLDLEVIPVMFVKQCDNRMRGLLVLYKSWKRPPAFGANQLLIRYTTNSNVLL